MIYALTSPVIQLYLRDVTVTNYYISVNCPTIIILQTFYSNYLSMCICLHRLEQASKSILMPSLPALNPISWQLELGRTPSTSSLLSLTRRLYLAGQPLLLVLLMNCLRHILCLVHHTTPCSTTCTRSSKQLCTTLMLAKLRRVLVLLKFGQGCFISA